MKRGLVVMCALSCEGLPEAPPPPSTGPIPLVARGVAVQTGTVTSAAAGTVTAALAPVDPTRAFLLFGARSESDRPVGTTLRGRLAGATTLEFTRVTDELTPGAITIRWYVVEYASGVRVQRGEVAQTATVVDVPISPVASPAQAFVTFSKSCQADDTGWNDDDPAVVSLTAADNVQVRASTATPDHVVSWQVVELTDPTWIQVQRGSVALTGAALSVDATLPAPVDPARTFVLASLRSGAGGSDVGARMITAELIGPTTVRIRRDSSGVLTPDDIPEIHWQAIELKDGSRVQHGSATLAAGVPAAAIPLAPIDELRTAAILSGEGGPGEAMGRTPYVDDDVAGVALADTQLAGDTLIVRRTSVVAAATFGWFTIQFGPTCGDGVAEGDEACDGTICCTPTCTAGNAGTVCREAAGVCDQAEACDGVSGQCPDDAYLTGGECNPSGGPCDPAERCDGTSAECPADPGGGMCDAAGPTGGGSPDTSGDQGGATGDGTTSALACALAPGARAPSPSFAWALAIAALGALGARRRARMSRAEGCRSRSDSSGRDPGPAAPIRSNTRSCAWRSRSPSGMPSAPRG